MRNILIHYVSLVLLVINRKTLKALKRIVIRDIRDLPSPDQLPQDKKKLMIFRDKRAKEHVAFE